MRKMGLGVDFAFLLTCQYCRDQSGMCITVYLLSLTDLTLDTKDILHVSTPVKYQVRV